MFWRRVGYATVGLVVLAMSAIPATTASADIVPGPFSTATSTSTTPNTLSIHNPGAVAGELLLAQITFLKGTQAVFTEVPVGWTLANRTDVLTEVGQAIFYKVATGSESDNFTWTFNIGAAKSAGSVMRFSGVSTVAELTNNSGSTGTMTATGTTVSQNSMIVALYGVKNTVSVTAPAEMFGIYNQNSTEVTICAARQTMPGERPADKVATAGIANPWVAQLVELRAIAAQTFTLSYAAGAGGTLTGDTNQEITEGGSGTQVTAVPNTGYHFVNWSDSSTANPRTDNGVVADISVTANFAINLYTLTYDAGLNGTIDGTTPQIVSYGESGSAVTAQANTGYHFAGWSDAKTDNPRTDTNVTGNINVTANFVQDTVNYTLRYAAGLTETSLAPRRRRWRRVETGRRSPL